jgi:hypothetical protein
VFVAAAACALATASVAQTATPPGADKSATTRTLEAGAKALQRTSPLEPIDIHLVGFHPRRSTRSGRFSPTTTARRSTRISRSACCSTATVATRT